jgi:hypothetical protein
MTAARLLCRLALAGIFVGVGLAALSVAAQSPAPAPSGDKPAAPAAPAASGDAAAEDIGVPKTDSAEALLREVSNEAMTAAIKEGLKYLADMQDEKGFWGEENPRVFTTSISASALMASGSLPDSGPYGKNLTRALDWVLKAQDPNSGYISGDTDGSRIHGHGAATTFLAEVYGHSGRDKEVKKALDAAVQCLEKGQTKEGGWGYVPSELGFDENSTTVCCLQGLRTAQNAGVKVSNTTIARAMGYFEKSACAQTFRDKEGQFRQGYTFKYSLNSGESTSYALVAACCSCLNYLGVYSKYGRWDQKKLGEILDGGMRWLRYQWDDFSDRVKTGGGGLDTNNFLYATFYATQATWQYSDVSYFRYYFPKIRDMLIEDRRNSGTKGWRGSYGPAFGTAYSLLILQVPYQYLPSFQR